MASTPREVAMVEKVCKALQEMFEAVEIDAKVTFHTERQIIVVDYNGKLYPINVWGDSPKAVVLDIFDQLEKSMEEILAL